MTPGDRAKALRKAFSFTQEELGRRVGMSRVGVAQVETGANQLQRRDSIRVWARAFGVSMDTLDGYLLGEVELDDVLMTSVSLPVQAEAA